MISFVVCHLTVVFDEASPVESLTRTMPSPRQRTPQTPRARTPPVPRWETSWRPWQLICNHRWIFHGFDVWMLIFYWNCPFGIFHWGFLWLIDVDTEIVHGKSLHGCFVWELPMILMILTIRNGLRVG